MQDLGWKYVYPPDGISKDATSAMIGYRTRDAIVLPANVSIVDNINVPNMRAIMAQTVGLPRDAVVYLSMVKSKPLLEE